MLSFTLHVHGGRKDCVSVFPLTLLHRVGDGASATISTSDGRGRLLEKHKDFPLRLWSLEMSKMVFDVE